ncbi:hypothetical protein D3C75_830380 [compost metagenome]
MNMLIQRLAAALQDMQHNLLHNLNKLLIHLGNELLILFLLFLVPENKHLLHRGEIDLIACFTVKPDPLANNHHFGILGMLGYYHIIIKHFSY